VLHPDAGTGSDNIFRQALYHYASGYFIALWDQEPAGYVYLFQILQEPAENNCSHSAGCLQLRSLWSWAVLKLDFQFDFTLRQLWRIVLSTAFRRFPSFWVAMLAGHTHLAENISLLYSSVSRAQLRFCS
jgi:hypothetical protein